MEGSVSGVGGTGPSVPSGALPEPTPITAERLMQKRVSFYLRKASEEGLAGRLTVSYKINVSGGVSSSVDTTQLNGYSGDKEALANRIKGTIDSMKFQKPAEEVTGSFPLILIASR